MVVPVVLSQHAEEAAFLWLLRDSAVRAPHYYLKDVAKLDDRAEAHLDGLRIGAEAGWEAIQTELSWEEAGEVFVAAFLAYETGDAERIEAALEVGTSSTDLARGVISALGWLPKEQVLPHISALLASDDPMCRRIGLGGAAVHRYDPKRALVDAIDGEEALPRGRALKAAGELGRSDLLAWCQGAYVAEEDDVRFWAAWSGALLGDVQSIHPLAAISQDGHPRSFEAADLATRRMPLAQAHAWLQQLADDAARHRLGVTVAGAIGDPAVVPWLFEMMTVDDVARAAGEAFSTLTGLDLGYEDLEGEWPDGFEAGPTEDPADENVEVDEDEDLPWPDPDLIRHWWTENQGAYTLGTRYLLGQPISATSLLEVLSKGRQRQRRAAALELALMDPSRSLFEVRAPAARQRRLLSQGYA